MRENGRASPPHHTPLQLVSSFRWFSHHSLLAGRRHYSSQWEPHGRTTCTLPLRSIFCSGLSLTAARSMFTEGCRCRRCGAPTLELRVPKSNNSTHISATSTRPLDFLKNFFAHKWTSQYLVLHVWTICWFNTALLSLFLLFRLFPCRHSDELSSESLHSPVIDHN